ncbi:MAG: hypothetical protein IJD04_04125 [Desulfovibrionaceae bacterium]|nr:hypothetical protein [Desulfovibrionaceae bacterium]
MYFTLALLTPPDAVGSGLDDVRRPLYHALRKLGHKAELLHQCVYKNSQNIIFGLHDRPDISLDTLPEDVIIYNLEQVTLRSRALRPQYLEAMRRFRVWDYSLRNIERLQKDYGVRNIVHVPLGYMPQMTVINPDYPKDIDVLLYGCPNPRRKAVIDELRRRGRNALLACDVFGAVRDGLIARSRLVLNVHFYLPGILEIVRISYLLANRIPVVSELNPDTEIPAGYEEACVYCPYAQLADVVTAALDNGDALRAQGMRGHEIFARRDYVEIVSNALFSAAR